MDGVALIESIIFLAIAVYVEATVLPQALTLITTAALVSISGAIATLFQVLTPIIVIIVTILLYVRIIKAST